MSEVQLHREASNHTGSNHPRRRAGGKQGFLEKIFQAVAFELTGSHMLSPDSDRRGNLISRNFLQVGYKRADVATSLATQSFGKDGVYLLAIAIPCVLLRRQRSLLSETLT